MTVTLSGWELLAVLVGTVLLVALVVGWVAARVAAALLARAFLPSDTDPQMLAWFADNPTARGALRTRAEKLLAAREAASREQGA